MDGENKAGRLLDEIGRLLAEDTEYPLDGTLLYAELDWNYVAPSIFKDRGDHIVYRDPDLDRLGDALLALWTADGFPRRWAAIEYLVRDDKFHATFTYPEEVNLEEGLIERSTRVAKRHFGDKPIVYPPILKNVPRSKSGLSSARMFYFFAGAGLSPKSLKPLKDISESRETPRVTHVACVALARAAPT